VEGVNPRDRSKRTGKVVVEAHTHTQSVLMAIFPGEPGLAGCPLN